MFRALLKAIVVLVIIVGIAAFFIGYEFANPEREFDRQPVVGTSGTIDAPDVDAPDINVDAARDVGADIGAAVATGANEAGQVLNRAALTAKIKSKMTLDDSIEARTIDVDTASDGVVTLSGTVDSEAERARALQLARETEGVTSVTDRLQLR